MSVIKLNVNEEYLKDLKASGQLNQTILQHKLLIDSFLDSIIENGSLKPLDEIFSFKNGEIEGVKHD